MLADGLSFVARTSQPPLAVVSKAPLSKLVEVLRPVATRCRRRPRQYRKQLVAVATEIGGPKLLPAELNFATKASVCPPRTESKPPPGPVGRIRFPVTKTSPAPSTATACA